MRGEQAEYSFEKALEDVMQKEITKLNAENKKIEKDIREIDQMENEANGRRS